MNPCIGPDVLPAPLPEAPGTYVLLLHLRQRAPIQIGRLGLIIFQRGWYAYVGSAFGAGGLAARLGRHLQPHKKPHWHLDYLRALAEPRHIWLNTATTPLEHTWAAALAAGGARPIPGFGCSDCRCPSHLFYYRTAPRNLTGLGTGLKSYILDGAT